MTSTTLMTFMLTAPPQVRSVKLLGSWDHFSKPYAMERDRRVGSGQWRGCHTFSDITCDGRAQNMSSTTRSGGLRMGATYWYYYLLDDDVEYYNEAEPVTTRCPFLPGQPVNILQVPVSLPDSVPVPPSSREASPGSFKPDQRTMNPEDKYMNPREPPKPKPRQRTSPPPLHQPTPAWTFGSSPLNVLLQRSATQPSKNAPKFRSQDSQRGSGCRSVSPPRSLGRRSPFRRQSPDPSISTNEAEIGVALPGPDHGVAVSPRDPGEAGVGQHQEQKLPPNVTHDPLPEDFYLPRRPASDSTRESLPLSIKDRRALNHSKTVAHRPLQNPLTVRTRPEMHWDSTKREWSSTDPKGLLATAAELAMADDGTPRPFTFKEKRLPTLPNSPSSVMDEALRDLDAREEALENPGSHFSAFTESSTNSPPPDTSHFKWSTDTEGFPDSTKSVKSAKSVKSMATSSKFNPGAQMSPIPDRSETPELPESAVEPAAASELLQTGAPPPAVVDQGDPDTPHLTVNSRPSPNSLLGGDSPHWDVPVTLSDDDDNTNIASPADLDVPGLTIEDADDQVDQIERNPKRHAAFFGEIDPLEALGLARPPNAPPMRLHDSIRSDKSSLNQRGSGLSASVERGKSPAPAPGSEATMQEMMDELRYLNNMIQTDNVVQTEGGLI